MTYRFILNPEGLSPSFLPRRLPFRETEHAHLLNNVRNRVNTLVFGPIGSGKTALVKLVIRELGKDVVYINCLLSSSQYSVLKEILPSSRLIVYRSNFELLKELKNVANEKELTVCFDNFTQLKDANTIKRIFELGICMVLAGRVERDSPPLNENILSNFPSIIRLEKYTMNQTFEILKERARVSLDSSSYTDSLLKKIAQRIGGNITMALAILRAIALTAENQGKKSMDMISLSEMLPDEDVLDELGNDERTIYRILSETKSMPSSRLYSAYAERAKYPKCARSFRTYMENLCNKGLVRFIRQKKGRIYEIIGNMRNEGKKAK